MSGTLRNPHGNFVNLTMTTSRIPGSRRIEMTLSPDGLRRLQALKKSLGCSKRTEVIEALLFQGAVEHKIDPDLRGRMEQKIDYLIERIEGIT